MFKLVTFHESAQLLQNWIHLKCDLHEVDEAVNYYLPDLRGGLIVAERLEEGGLQLWGNSFGEEWDPEENELEGDKYL